MNDQDIARIILQQFGGGRFTAMTGANSLLAIERGLQFQLPRGFAKGGVTHVKVVLTRSDLYNMEFFKVGPIRYGAKKTTIKTYEGVFNDQLRDLFTQTTGLHTSL